MAKNDLTLLDSILAEYVSARIPSAKEDEAFEYFSTEQVLKDYVLSKEEILLGSVDGRNDGGIDEFYIFVNGHLVERIPADYWPKTHAELEVYIITCKHDDSFKQAPITTMIPSLIELFDFGIPSSNLAEYNEKLISKRELLISTYKRLAASLVKFDIHLIYTCRGDEKIESNIQAKADQAIAICNDSFSECNVSFEFWGNSRLLARYRERPSNVTELIYEQCINQKGQYIILASLKNYFKFLLDSKGKLNRRLFDSNVRDYLGLNPVNRDIHKTLMECNGPDFWWLNNGITIIGSKATIIGNTINITDVQIVNGLQTSESIYHYLSGETSEPANENDSRSVLIKILVSSDKAINDSIIYATNNQTNVNVTALRATDKIQKDIEEILKANRIYYERKTNYYENQGITEESIITPLSIAAGYICLIYKNPFIATSLKQKFMRDNRKYEKVFSPSSDIRVWIPIAVLLKKTDKYLSELKTEIRGNIFRLQKNYRQIIVFITVSRIMGTFAFGEKDLIAMNLEKYTKDEVEKSIQDLIEVDPDCFSRTKKPTNSFYSEVYTNAEKKYGIKAIQSIQAKKRLLLSDNTLKAEFGLSKELLDQIMVKLPSQPWPGKIHESIAEELGVSKSVVSDAIAYLIYSKRLKYQVYGFVFDDEDNVICEGDHYNRSIEDARAKLKGQKIIYENRFGF